MLRVIQLIRVLLTDEAIYDITNQLHTYLALRTQQIPPETQHSYFNSKLASVFLLKYCEKYTIQGQFIALEGTHCVPKGVSRHSAFS